tara:strand:+ start:515 stop:649 length:135 start_codon:yes stop_codon:yes gene_type:complete
MEELMMQGLEKFLFDNDWIDTDVVCLLDEDDLTLNEEDAHDTEN